jgi:secreted trypsin-like serine protease
MACSQAAAPVSSQASAVYGGTRDDATRPSAGYLLQQTSSSARCAVTLIAPRLLVTAAHCVPTGGTWRVAFGAYSADNASFQATAFPSPLYDGSVDHDIAVLLLDEAQDREIAAIVPPSAKGKTVESFGHGRTDGNVADSLRRHALQCANGAAGTLVRATGIDSGLCYGDSGSGLFRQGRAEVQAVLSRGDMGNNICYVGSRELFVSISEHLNFVNDVLNDAGLAPLAVTDSDDDSDDCDGDRFNPVPGSAASSPSPGEEG